MKSGAVSSSHLAESDDGDCARAVQDKAKSAMSKMLCATAQRFVRADFMVHLEESKQRLYSLQHLGAGAVGLVIAGLEGRGK